ncbi:MAG: hypothetical protein ACI9A7_002587, partial [Cyclobacteriaceae bacterium]
METNQTHFHIIRKYLDKVSVTYFYLTPNWHQLKR